MTSSVERASLPADLERAVRATTKDWAAGGKVGRIWKRDASLWTGADEAEWIGWLDIVDQQLARLDALRRAGDDARAGGFRHAAVLGMGGSSLCPEVLRITFSHIAGHPELHVLDSTDPAQVRALEKRVDLQRTLFIVSSKSGTTLEPNIFEQYFFERVQQTVGRAAAGQRFVAITDPGSKLEQVAKAEAFRQVFHGLPSIGGRYSALSDFGMVPGVVMGLDVGRLLTGASRMAQRCGAGVPVEDNPGAMLGIVLGEAARQGRDKVTLIASSGLVALGGWLEQLLAESTGKQGRGLIPVDHEPMGGPSVYGSDRVFVHVRLAGSPDRAQDDGVAALERAGHPVVRIDVGDPYELGAEFFRWEFATAVAGAVIGINPFDQPDVEASKIATRRLTDAYEQTGTLPAEKPLCEGDGVKLFADPRNAAELAAAGGARSSVGSLLRAHLGRIRPGDYAAILAYIEMSEANDRALQSIRVALRDRFSVATCLGFGPRFLHSTGQVYKGGPNSGVVLQITCDDAADLPVPGQKYTFGVVKAAQARGDFEVLAERGRRVLRIHLGEDVGAGLSTLDRLVRDAS